METLTVTATLIEVKHTETEKIKAIDAKMKATGKWYAKVNRAGPLPIQD
jgi:hypothetical protein